MGAKRFVNGCFFFTEFYWVLQLVHREKWQSFIAFSSQSPPKTTKQISSSSTEFLPSFFCSFPGFNEGKKKAKA